jgi:protein-disulfide isomerase
MADGDSLSVQATPTFFINGQKQTGGLPYNDFKAKIDAALK